MNQLKTKHVWKKARVTMGDGYIEVREAKLLATVGLVLMLTWPAAIFVLLWCAGSHAGGIDRSTLTVLGFVLSIPAVAAICFYRLPRVVRLYPEERLAHAFRGVFDKACFSRWHDLGDAKPHVRRAYIIENAGAHRLITVAKHAEEARSTQARLRLAMHQCEGPATRHR